jgi:hypothetical protein
MDELERSQEALGKALDRARMGEDRDLAGQVRDAGERCVRQLFGCLRMTRLHDLENAAFARPIEELRASLGELHELLGAIHLVSVEGQVYVNDVRVRLDERLDTAAALGRELARHDLGGISFHEVPTEAGIKQFIAAFAADPHPDHPRAALRQRLNEVGLDRMDLVGPFRFRVSGEAAQRSDVTEEKSRDRTTNLADSTMDSLGSARMPNPLPVRRAVTELLEGGAGADALLAEPAHSTPYSRHVLRVSVLALTIGQKLGLSEEALQDLGVTAMFHDVGYAAREGSHPGAGIAPVSFAPPYSRHGSAGARMLLRQRGFHESKILRALAALQHTRSYDDPSGRPSLFARILHVCEAYDGLTFLGPQRMSPPRALAAIQTQSNRRYDPVVVQALINGLGRYPPGTRMRLQDGRIVEAIGFPESQADWDRPKCRLIRDFDGRRPTELELVDLAWDPAEVQSVAEPLPAGS